MITTKQINVNLGKGKIKLRQATTKNIDAGLRVEPPKEPIKPRGISTTSLPDIADIAEKRRRDEIMAERKKGDVPQIDEKELKKLNRQYVFVDFFCEDVIQGYPRRLLK